MSRSDFNRKYAAFEEEVVDEDRLIEDMAEEEILEVIGSPMALSLFRDSNLNERDLAYLGHLHRSYSDENRLDCVSVVLQNLWKEYSFTFSDPTLLYAILAWGSSFNWKFSFPRQRVGDHEVYKNKFRIGLIKAANEGSTSEAHFFAALFAVLTSFHRLKNEDEYQTLREFNAENEELRVYQSILLTLLKKLNEQEANKENPQGRKLQHLYNYVLSLVRLWASESATAAINYDMHLVSEKIPMPTRVVDKRATYALPAQFWLRLGQAPDWQGLEWSVSDDIRALFACFQKMLTLNRQEQEKDSPANQLLQRSIKVLQTKAIKMQQLNCTQHVLTRVFKFVS